MEAAAASTSRYHATPPAFSIASTFKRVGTHSGSFHCDEALELLETLDAVLDVGSVYDPSEDRYDHHQEGFNEAIDATDNGINQYIMDLPPKYVNNTHLSPRVGHLNLEWIDPEQSSEAENAAFYQAMILAGGELLESIRFHARSRLPARSIVVECLASRRNVDPNGEIMVLDRFCPLKLHLFDLEEELKINPQIKYVIYQDERRKNWRVQAVSISPEKFDSRRQMIIIAVVMRFKAIMCPPWREFVASSS